MWCSSIYLFYHGYPINGGRAHDCFREDSSGVIRFLWSPWHRWICFHCLIEPWKPIPRSHGNHGWFDWDWETDPMVSLKPRKPILWSHWNHGKQSQVSLKLRKTNPMGIIETPEPELCKWLSQIARRIWRHMPNSFSPWIRALAGP
jgi:hypothetical protein